MDYITPLSIQTKVKRAFSGGLAIGMIQTWKGKGLYMFAKGLKVRENEAHTISY